MEEGGGPGDGEDRPRAPAHGASVRGAGRGLGWRRRCAVLALLVAYAVGGDPAISDTWIAYLAGVAMVGGLFASLVAFLLAGFARIRHEVAPRLWLPLTLFPALLALLVVAEVFWLE